MRILYIAITFVGILLSPFCIADPWHGYTKVTHLYPSHDGYFFFVKDGLPSQSTCDNGRRFYVALDHPNYQALVSALMVAYTADVRVRFNINGRVEPDCAASINRLMLEGKL